MSNKKARLGSNDRSVVINGVNIMFGTKIYCLLLLLLGSTNCFSQSEALSELKQEISKGNFKAVLDVVTEPSKAQDESVKKYLTELMADKQQRVMVGRPSYFAHIAMAKMHDKEAIDGIIAEIESDHPLAVIGMKKLYLVGGKVAIKKFYSLLDDTTQIDVKKSPNDQTDHENDGFFYPKNVMAILYLSQIVENPPTRPGVPSNKIALWKEWFIVNRHLIEE